VLLAALQLSRRYGGSVDWLGAGRRVVAPRVVFNLVLIPLVYQLLGRLDRRFSARELTL
jgi:hypothetical protein